MDHKHTIPSLSIICAQLCPTLFYPVDCSLPGSSVHGDSQARILEWVAMPSSSWSSQPRDQTQVSHIAGGFFTSWATREARIKVEGRCKNEKPLTWRHAVIFREVRRESCLISSLHQILNKVDCPETLNNFPEWQSCFSSRIWYNLLSI